MLYTQRIASRVFSGKTAGQLIDVAHALLDAWDDDDFDAEVAMTIMGILYLSEDIANGILNQDIERAADEGILDPALNQPLSAHLNDAYSRAAAKFRCVIDFKQNGSTAGVRLLPLG